MLLLTISALVIFLTLIILLESLVLQLLSWGTFQRSMMGSAVANLASGIPVFYFLGQVPRTGATGMLAGLGLAILIEGWLLQRLRPEAIRASWFAAVAANIVSYAILLFPTYWFSPK